MSTNFVVQIIDYIDLGEQRFFSIPIDSFQFLKLLHIF